MLRVETQMTQKMVEESSLGRSLEGVAQWGPVFEGWSSEDMNQFLLPGASEATFDSLYSYIF